MIYQSESVIVVLACMIYRDVFNIIIKGIFSPFFKGIFTLRLIMPGKGFKTPDLNNACFSYCVQQ